MGDNNRTDVEDCRSFCQGQSGAAFFTFNEKRKSCGCRATKGESENARGTHSGIIFDQPKLWDPVHVQVDPARRPPVAAGRRTTKCYNSGKDMNGRCPKHNKILSVGQAATIILWFVQFKK